MSDPCKQEAAIKNIEITLARVAIALETIAAQGAAITFLQKEAEDAKKDIDTLYSRVRNIELQPGRELSKIKVGVASAVISAVVTTGGMVILQHLLN